MTLGLSLLCGNWEVQPDQKFPLPSEDGRPGCNLVIIPLFSCVKAIHHGASGKNKVGTSTTSGAPEVTGPCNFTGSLVNEEGLIRQPWWIQTIHNSKTGSVKVNEKQLVKAACLKTVQ